MARRGVNELAGFEALCSRLGEGKLGNGRNPARMRAKSIESGHADDAKFSIEFNRFQSRRSVMFQYSEQRYGEL
jgi:hypothetical protein